METPNLTKAFDDLKLQRDLIDAPWVKCECGGMLYEEVTMFKRLSSLLSPTGNTENIPARVVICKKCQLVPNWFSELVPEIPKEVTTACNDQSA